MFYYIDKIEIYKLKGKIHDRIVLYRQNYLRHIKVAHSEISMKKIIDILGEPDYVYKKSRKSKDYFYEKKIGKDNYRIVISKYKPSIKQVVTGYKLNSDDCFDEKRIYCIYDSKDKSFYNKELENEEDIDYFIEPFKEVY